MKETKRRLNNLRVACKKDTPVRRYLGEIQGKDQELSSIIIMMTKGRSASSQTDAIQTKRA